MKLSVKDYEAGRDWMRGEAEAFAERLAPVYEAAKHFWTNDKDEKFIPNRDQILKRLMMLIDTLHAPDGTEGYFNRCGGLEVGVVQDGAYSYEAFMRYELSVNMFESASEDA